MALERSRGKLLCGFPWRRTGLEWLDTGGDAWGLRLRYALCSLSNLSCLALLMVAICSLPLLPELVPQIAHETLMIFYIYKHHVKRWLIGSDR